jgi:catechol 2,3-dioxygenase-like lactoylglutathione lyase family enzyme
MIRHIAGIAEIVEDVEAAVNFYRNVLGLPVDYETGAAYATVEVNGILHFGIWSRSAAAESVFGDPAATERIPLGFTLGLEVNAVQPASEQIAQQGWPLAQPPRTEPWGQTTSRFFATSGALCEVSETPWARKLARPMEAQSGDTGTEEDS